MSKNHVIESKDLSIYYADKCAVKKVSLAIQSGQVVAIIGPSGCGKSTFLRAINRMNDFIPDVHIEGELLFCGTDIYNKKVDPVDIRKRIGMVFQKPNPFPKSIYQNIIWGPKINGFQGDLNELLESSLKRAALWDEVKDRLHSSALSLSGGQQQRLCIARAIALQPEVILMDEPCSALDPIATGRIEDLMTELKQNYTIVVVTHNMQQAARISDETHFFYQGELIESGMTKSLFTTPNNKRTEDYITGRFG